MNKRKERNLSIDDIWDIYNKAKEHSIYIDEENGSSRNLEAFLLLATLFEAALVSLALTLLEKREDLSALRGKRGKRYGIENAINDLYLLGALTTEEFGLLEQLKDSRNKGVHDLFSMNNEEIEKEMHTLFDAYSELFEVMVEKLEKELHK